MFTKTRIRLTVWYLLIIMLISGMFSISIYHILTGELERGFHRITERYTQQLGPLPPTGSLHILEPAYLQASENRIAWTLAYVNIIIFFVSGIGGYILAGVTLHPIKKMIDEQNRFITDASHELRTPLTSLRSEIEVFLREKHPTIKDATIIAKSNLEEVENLQILSESLMQLAQDKHSSQPSPRTPLALADVFQEAIKKLQKVAKPKHITLHITQPDEAVLGNKEELIQLMSLLLDNAIKYSPDKTKVKIYTETVDGFVKIFVSDEGIGIAEKDMPYIFDRFYRADNSRSKQHVQGFGLGLSIAKKIVSVHHGSIRVQSELQKGSTFIVELPLA